MSLNRVGTEVRARAKDRATRSLTDITSGWHLRGDHNTPSSLVPAGTCADQCPKRVIYSIACPFSVSLIFTLFVTVLLLRTVLRLASCEMISLAFEDSDNCPSFLGSSAGDLRLGSTRVVQMEPSPVAGAQSLRISYTLDVVVVNLLSGEDEHSTYTRLLVRSYRPPSTLSCFLFGQNSF